MSNIKLVPIDKLVMSKYNPRQVRDPERLNIVAESIARDGIKNALLVRRTGDMYEVLDGGRRLEAAKRLGIKQLPCRVEDIDDDKALARMVLRFHLAQEDLTPEEIVNAIKSYVDEGIFESEREACRELNISHSTLLYWKKQAQLTDQERVNMLVEEADISEEAKEIILSSGLSRDYAKEIVKALELNPRADVKRLVEKYVNAEVREVEPNVFEARGEFIYRAKVAGQNIVLEIVSELSPVAVMAIPRLDLMIVKRLLKKVS